MRYESKGNRLCLIPARGGSKRLPRKNLLTIGGTPLIGHAIQTAKLSGLFSDVFVSTDDFEIAEVAKSYGAIVPFLRPSSLATAASSLVDVTLHFLDNLASSYNELCLLMPTSPLREVEDVVTSYSLFHSLGCNFLMSVTRYINGSPYWALQMDESACLSPLFNYDSFSDTHNHSALYCPCGVVRWAKTSPFQDERTFYGSDLHGYIVPAIRAIEIDEPEDIDMAEALFTANNHGRHEAF